MRHEHLFQLTGIDVVAAAYDHILPTIDDEEIAILIHIGDITSVEPPATHGLLRRLGAIVVALHYAVPTHNDFSRLPLLYISIVVIHQTHLSGKEWTSDGAG